MAQVHYELPPEQRLIRRYTDALQLPISTVYIRAAGRAVSQISLPELAQLIEQGSILSQADVRIVAHFDTLLGEFELDLRPMLEQALFRSSSAGELVFAENLGVPPIDVALFRAEAQQTARTMVGQLIQGIQHGWMDPVTGLHHVGSLEMVQNVIAEGYQVARTPTATARLVADIVGLDAKRAEQLMCFRATLEAQGVKGRSLESQVRKERQRLLKQRGYAIGHTESVRAASRAQDMIWGRAISEGQIEEGEYEQVWVPSPHACPVCQGLRGARAPIGGRFRSPGGDGPPDPHPHCRCGRRLVRPER